MIKLLSAILLIFFFTTFTHAADLQVSVTVDKHRITLQDKITLTISIRGNGVEHMQLPALFPPTFTVIDKTDKPNLSQDAFGHPISGRVIRYQLQPTAGGRFRLGAFSVNYFGEIRSFNGELIDVAGPKPTTNNRSNSGTTETETEVEDRGPIDVRLSAEADHTRVYVGERITLAVRITHNAFAVDDIKMAELPQFTNFWNREIVLKEHVFKRADIKIKGHPYVTQLIPCFTLFPTTSGKLTIPALTYSMTVHSGPVTGTRMLQLKTEPITIEAIPLPEEGRPAQFQGAVGHCRLHVSLKDQVTRVGVPARLLLEIETDGNTDALTPPQLPAQPEYKVYESSRVAIDNRDVPPLTGFNAARSNKSKDDDNDEETAGVARWEVNIVPTTAGKVTIPSFDFAYFDPATRSYQTAESNPLTLEVAASAPQSENQHNSGPGFFMRLAETARFRYALIALICGLGIALAYWLARARVNVTAPAAVAVQTAPAEPPLVGQVNRIVNSSYGKLRRGDERAYAGDLLRALRTIFENGFEVSAAEMSANKIAEALSTRGATDALRTQTIKLYEDCERICFMPSPTTDSPDRDRDYARFNEARNIVNSLLKLLPQTNG